MSTDEALVRRLLQDQFPQWADLPITPVESYGTDHDIYRLGTALSVRLPRREWVTDQAAKEAEWLPRLAPQLPLAIPEQVAAGSPAAGFPFPWSVYTWLPGTPVSAGGLFSGPGALEQAATDLAAFITALRKIDPTGAPARPLGRRGGHLSEFDGPTRRAIADLDHHAEADSDLLLDLWQESLDAPLHTGPDVWIHGDLLPGNLLTTDGRLSGVIDFGALNTGDPACDLQPAWNVFTAATRARFHSTLGDDEPARLRGRGWALFQAATAISHYRGTNPGMLAQATNAISEILAGG
ncbi:aminoglycoside phosphotransferase family protein [Flindersiella endophytica]